MGVLSYTEITNLILDRAQVNVTTDAPVGAAELLRAANEAYGDMWEVSGGRLRTVASATAWASAEGATGVVTGILTDVKEIRHLFASSVAASVGQSVGDVELDPCDPGLMRRLRTGSGWGSYTAPKVYCVTRLATDGTEADSSATYVYPDADSTDGSWTDIAGGTTLYSSIDETSPGDSDYIKSSNTAADTFICTLGDFAVAPASGQSVTLRYRMAADGDAAAVVYLMEGITERASQTPTLTAKFADFGLVLSEAQRASIGVWTNLLLKVVKSGTAGRVYLSSARVEKTGTPSSANLLRLDYWPGTTGYYFPIHYIPQFRPFDGTIVTPDLNDIESRDLALIAAARICPLVGRAEFVPSILADVSERTAKVLERKFKAMLAGDASK